MKKSSLGKGLSALVAEQVLETVSGEHKGSILMVNVESIIPSRYQPRKEFNEEYLGELAQSILKHGVIQPLVVSDLGGDKYELIAGERRLRASKKAGLKEVPVVLREFAEKDRLAVALIENIQREDLNAIEVAEAYKEMMDRLDASQEHIAALVGKSRTAVANTLRLLKLPETIKQMILDGKLSEGHGRALLGLDDSSKLSDALEDIIELDFSVRQTEELVRSLNQQKSKTVADTESKIPSDISKNDKIKLLENKLVRDLGLKIEIQGDLDKGYIKVFYYTKDDLENFLKTLPSKQL